MRRHAIILSAGLLATLFLFCAFKSNPKGPREGDIAPDIRLPESNGDTLKLSSLKGHMVLVHFWAAWCPVCSSENKKIVKTFENFKDKEYKTGSGLIILYVSLDQNKKEWEKAIKEYGMSGDYNVCDLKKWQSLAVQTYKVNFVPDNFLIDGNGKIIAQGQVGTYMTDYLKDEIKK